MNKKWFRRKPSPSLILTIHGIIEEVRAKNLEAILLFVDLSLVFDSIHKGKMEQILLAYGPSKETVITSIMILYRNTKVKIRSPDGHTDFFDIVAVVLHGDTLASDSFIICLDYILWASTDLIKENGFTLKKKTRIRRYPAENITDADYADVTALRPNTPIYIYIYIYIRIPLDSELSYLGFI